jgi:hypothetical protein
MSDTEWELAGTVEILRLRIYPLDPQTADQPLATSVAVEPGVYPVYRKADAYCWVMTGRLNERQEKIADGLFVMHRGDNPSGVEVQFPSRIRGAEEFAELLAHPTCQPGPDQRLRFSLNEQVPA